MCGQKKKINNCDMKTFSMLLLFFKQKTEINHHEKILGFQDISQWPIINEILALKEPFDKLWDISLRMLNLLNDCMNGSLADINSLEKEV